MIVPAGGFRHQQVTVGGADIHVVEAGDPGAPPFVFLHGWPESSRAWAQIMTGRTERSACFLSSYLT
jgi:pimeloyl-ACP methyl ester carboxylesterase